MEGRRRRLAMANPINLTHEAPALTKAKEIHRKEIEVNELQTVGKCELSCVMLPRKVPGITRSLSFLAWTLKKMFGRNISPHCGWKTSSSAREAKLWPLKA